MTPETTHFGPGHVLAAVAARHCVGHRSRFSHAVACGACWERAIRDDERFAVECGLPRELTPDPNYVDEIAVDLACQGERVELTPVEFAAAAQRLHGRAMTPGGIANRLHTSYRAVIAVLHPELIGAAA